MSEQELRELDRQVHEKVMGLNCVSDAGGLWDCGTEPDYGDESEVVPRYSADIAAAWLVLPKLLESDFRLTLTAPGGFTDEGLGGGDPAEGGWFAVFKRPEPAQSPEESWERYMDRCTAYRDVGYGKGETASEAICRAALEAVK